jgi:hypothetical protein
MEDARVEAEVYHLQTSALRGRERPHLIQEKN